MKEILNVVPLFYYIFIGFGVYIILVKSVKSKSSKFKKMTVYALCFIDVLTFAIYKYIHFTEGMHIANLLPLHLCSIGIVLIPMALYFSNDNIMDFNFYIVVPGALAAILIPSSENVAALLSIKTITFFIFHAINAMLPLLIEQFGFYESNPSIKKGIKLSVQSILLIYSMHGFNIVLGRFTNIEVNYFYTIARYAVTTNVAFRYLYGLIPYNVLYIIPLGTLVLWGNMLIQSIKKRKRSLKFNNVKKFNHN